MWYFTWILGLLLACSLGIINVLRLEAQEALAKETLPLDPLTQLFTPASIGQRLREKVQNSRRNHAPFSLIFISLEAFIRQNPLSAHEHDAIVREVVAVLKKSLRTGLDLAARLESETFLLVLPGVSLNTAKETATVIRQAVSATVKTSDNLTATVQSGAAEYTPDSENSVEQEVEKLVSQAQTFSDDRHHS